MAKKQKRPAPGAKGMSAERYIREKARKLPVDKCYISSDWEESGMAAVIIIRRQPSGKLVIGRYLVDMQCLGVKDCDYCFNAVDADVKQIIEDYDVAFEETTYDVVHNLILGAVEFAEEAGFKPHSAFGIAKYILDEDSDDIPLIEYDYGVNGLHHITVDEFTDPKTLDTLRRKLDPDKYTVTYSDGSPYLEGVDAVSHREDMQKWHEEHPDVEYHYQLPDYPSDLVLKHPFIAELLDPKYLDSMSRALAERIIALPPEEAAADLSALIMYAIGRTHADSDFPENSAIFHAVLLLGVIAHPSGLDAMLEIMRQSFEWVDNNLGDMISEEFGVLLGSVALSRLDDLERFMYEPGLDELNTVVVNKAWSSIVLAHPDMRDRVTEVFRRLLAEMADKLTQHTVWGPCYAAHTISILVDLHAEELLPEIKRVYDTGWVDPEVCGGYDEVVDDMAHDRNFASDDTPDNIYDIYDIYGIKVEP